jgi:tetratricopeptide (TPR) repeat protein
MQTGRPLGYVSGGTGLVSTVTSFSTAISSSQLSALVTSAYTTAPVIEQAPQPPLAPALFSGEIARLNANMRGDSGSTSAAPLQPTAAACSGARCADSSDIDDRHILPAMIERDPSHTMFAAWGSAAAKAPAAPPSALSLDEQLLSDILNCKMVPLERALLIASGLETEEAVAQYRKKLDLLHQQFTKFKRKRGGEQLSQTETARLLHAFLWEKWKPNERYDSHYRLTDVIDAQLERRKHVGNCLGLTCLFSVLGLREGLSLSIMETATHVYTRLRAGHTPFDIENTSHSGAVTHTKETKWEAPVSFLIALVYKNRGLHRSKMEDLAGAVEDLERASILGLAGSYELRDEAVEKLIKILDGVDHRMALIIELPPVYAAAYLHRGVREPRRKEKIEDFRKALRINEAMIDAHYNLGEALFQEKEYAEAIEHLSRVLEMNPEDRDRGKIRLMRGQARLKLGDPASAIDDLTLALERLPGDRDLLQSLNEAVAASRAAAKPPNT